MQGGQLERDFFANWISRLNNCRESDDIPGRIIEMVQECLQVEQVLLVALDGQSLDPLEYSESWGRQGAKDYSLGVIHKALASSEGCWHGTIERNPSRSQMLHNILSCLSARIDFGGCTIGLIYCDIREGDRRFTPEDAIALKQAGDFCAPHFNWYLSRRKSAGRSGSDAKELRIDSVLLGETPTMKALKTEIVQIASLSSTPVLIRGERGTGKEIVASLLHQLSNRRDRELVVVHCAAIPCELFQSELFGHEKGAFTGALKRRDGRVWSAEGGTLFFDEIGDVPIHFQTRLLRLLQNRKYYRVGSDVPVGPIDVRFLFATNMDLEKMMAEGAFREDFYDRIAMGRILHVPPLRERMQDIGVLARRFALPRGISEDAISVLLRVRSWPGNVRQLESVVAAASGACAEPVVGPECILRELKVRGLLRVAASSEEPAGDPRAMYRDGKITQDDLRDLLSRCLEQFGTWSRVARHFGCSSGEEVRSFQHWISKLQASGILPRRASNRT